MFEWDKLVDAVNDILNEMSIEGYTPERMEKYNKAMDAIQTEIDRELDIFL